MNANERDSVIQWLRRKLDLLDAALGKRFGRGSQRRLTARDHARRATFMYAGALVVLIGSIVVGLSLPSGNAQTTASAAPAATAAGAAGGAGAPSGAGGTAPKPAVSASTATSTSVQPGSSPLSASSASPGTGTQTNASPATSANPVAAPQDGTQPGGANRVPRWPFLLLAIAIVIWFVLRYMFSPSTGEGRADLVMAALVGVYVAGLIMTPFLGLHGDDWMVLDFAALAVSLAAGFFGFLFGLPQAVVQTGASTPSGAPVQAVAAASTANLRPSTNLETVSDSLTKFITGAAFASLAAATAYITQFGDFVNKALTPTTQSGQLLGAMILIAYGSLGFVIAYIITRTVLSQSFSQADDALLHTGQTLDAVLPDAGSDATDEQKLLAHKIVNVSFESLKNRDQRLTWARAQTIVGDTAKARVAYATLYGTNAADFDVVIEFATALYNDHTFHDESYVLSLVTRAEELVAKDDDDGHARIAALRAATYLYVSGGYVHAIETVNAFLNTGLILSKMLRFYRACGFGQLYRAYKDQNGDPPVLSETDKTAIAARITNDTAITVAFGKEFRARVRAVANPPPRIPVVPPAKDTEVQEDDLQAFAADHSDYATKLLGLASAPNYPDKHDSGEPIFVSPLPGNLTPAQLADQSPP